MDETGIKELLGRFLVDVLGLELQSQILDKNILTRSQRLTIAGSENGQNTGIAWRTDRGIVIARAAYDESTSLRLKAHVLQLEWCIGAERHVGFWHSYPKFPHDWIKGAGAR